MLALIGLVMVAGAGVLVLGCRAEGHHPSPSDRPGISPVSGPQAVTTGTPAARVGRKEHDNGAAKFVARTQAGAVFAKRMREVDPDIRITIHGKGHTILRLNGRTCGTETLAAFARDSTQHLRDMGFERLECRGSFERADLEL